MKKRFSNRWLAAITCLLCIGAVWLARAQIDRLGPGKNFMLPDYYPSTNGVVRKRSVLTGAEYYFISNTVIALKQPRIEFFKEDGTTLEWTAIAHEAIVDINSREVRGNTNMFFRTADESLFLTGVGFLWQQSNSVLILSNRTFTWIDTQKLTNSSSKNPTNKMKALLAVSLISTARLTAAEMEIPPARFGLTITAGVHILDFKNNQVLYSNNVLVTYPSAKTNEPATYLRCDWSTAKRGANGQIEEIAAHGKVAIDQGDQHARGNFGLYTATNEMMALVGTFDPTDFNRPRPYLYASQVTNGVEVTKWFEDGDAILYDGQRLQVQNPNARIAPDQLKSFSPPDSFSTNTSRTKDTNRLQKASPPPN